MPAPTEDSTAPVEVISDRDRRCTGVAAEIARGLSLPAPEPEHLAAAGFLHDAIADPAMNVPWSELLTKVSDPASATALSRLHRQYAAAVAKPPSRLGSCPAVLFKALSLLRRNDVSMQELEKVVSCDAVLASSLLSFANSALFSHATPLRSISAAIAYVGVGAAKRVILAASSRPMFSSAELSGLWRHSVDVAAIAEHFAITTGHPDSGEVFVAGLIHDIGRLAIEWNTHDDFVLAHRRITHATGCAELADLVLTGQDHGQIGSTLLDTWGMPAELVNAVRFHHRPEQSPSTISSILYLAEYVAESEEMVESAPRLGHAMQVTGIASLDTAKSDLRRLGTALAMAG